MNAIYMSFKALETSWVWFGLLVMITLKMMMMKYKYSYYCDLMTILTMFCFFSLIFLFSAEQKINLQLSEIVSEIV